MKVIRKAEGRILKAWGKQKGKAVSYRLIKYVISNEIEGTLYLHHVITGEMIALSEKEKAFLYSLPQPLQEEGMELMEKHFIVPIDYDERKVVDQLRHLMQVLFPIKEITGYTILPTTHCNARCFYCFELGYHQEHMTPQRASEVVDYIISHSNKKKVSIQWFGGEPLVGMKIIHQISSELKEKGVEFTSSMISNGALFNEEVIQEAKDLWKLQMVQITIDGTEKIYNIVKAYVGMKDNPYKKVMHNIRLLSDAGIRVSIRINLGFHNMDDTQKLIQELSETFKDCENVTFYVHELFENEGKDARPYTDQERDQLMNMVNDLNQSIEIQGKYIRHMSLPSLKTGHCMADQDAHVIIQPGGQLCKCEHENAQESFGSIDSDNWNKEHLSAWKKHSYDKTCFDCPLYPNCYIPDQCPSKKDCLLTKQKNQKIKEVQKNMMLYLNDKKEKNEDEVTC